MNPVIERRVQRCLMTVGVVVTVMCVALVVACWRNDSAIDRHKATVTADVVYADRLHANVYFQTPDGTVHSPRLGLMYPTELTSGQRIRVDYSTVNADLVRPAGRSASLAIIPAVSVAVTGWAVVGALMLAVAQLSRRWARRRPVADADVPPPGAPDARASESSPVVRRPDTSAEVAGHLIR
ncbi:MAG: hypothetical protein QM673_17945 [Gordonia sp. (in: high G+C Gram-positive bacteria)]